MNGRSIAFHFFAMALVARASAEEAAPAHGPGGTASSPPTSGWRGNWTGLFPDANPPTTWHRIARGVTAGAICSAVRPEGDGGPRDGQPLRDGLIREWLVLGPLPFEGPGDGLDAETVPGEAALAPRPDEKAGTASWRRVEIPRTPDYERWGTTELDWLHLGEAPGSPARQVAYAHTYLFCERAGRAAIVVDHEHGLEIRVNGTSAYRAAKGAVGLGNYAELSRQARTFVRQPSPRCEFPLEKGWNRLLFKLSSSGVAGSRPFKFAARLLDAGPVPYDEKNIRWAAPLPGSTNACPIIVGDRAITVSEPDEVIALDKMTGAILWRRGDGLFETVPEEERAADPVFRDKIAPLAKELEGTADPARALEIRREIGDLLLSADRKRFGFRWDGHLASHFGIVGFTTTPASDGSRIYAFFGYGVAACHDLDGRRIWIRRLEAEEIRYSCSPALIGGKLICAFDGLTALDAGTGAIVWRQPGVSSIASLIPATVHGIEVVSTRDGRIFRASDGKLLWSNPQIHPGDTGWAAPAILGDVLYLPWHGVGELIAADFSQVQGEEWKPAVRNLSAGADNRRPGGEWLDRWTAGSPLIHQGIYYNIDQYGVFYAVDLASGKPLYRHDAGFDELHHYNAIGVGASAAMGGKFIYIQDNQGACAVLEPGPADRPVSKNRIETALPREWPIPPQEILANGPPVFDGDRIYIRGERHLYCIQEETR